jgi:preprotein translocase subunit SecG
MQLAINLLTLVLVVLAMFLGLLILLQLPKKEAGITAAFGAESTAAIFGAGSGTALTHLTRWVATAFLSLCLVIAVMTSRHTTARSTKIREAVATPAAATTTVNANPAAAPALVPTNAARPTAPAPIAPAPIAPAPSAPKP